MDDAPSIQISIRLPVALLEQVEMYASELRSERPGINVTRASAVRTLIVAALAHLDLMRSPWEREEGGVVAN